MHAFRLTGILLFCFPFFAFPQTPYRLIAHRGGIVEGRYPENSELSIQAAIDRGYWMVEIDVRETRDGVLISHHDPNFERFYGDVRRVEELNWAEIQTFRTRPWNGSCMSFEDAAALCAGKIQVMVDTKDPIRSPDAFARIEATLREHGLLDQAYFIGTREIRDYIKGKARISANRKDLKAALERGEAVDDLYFLFEHGNELDPETVAWAQELGVPVVPSVNVFHYRKVPHMEGAKRDIFWLKEAGVSEFQIDSEYDRWLLPERGPLSQGPFLGHIDARHARIWCRAADTGAFQLTYRDPAGRSHTLNQASTLAADFCMTWDLPGLEPATPYVFQIHQGENIAGEGQFLTPQAPEIPQRTKLIFGSCAEDQLGLSYPVWEHIHVQRPDALILLGDTPYIDTTHPDYQQRRYREFYEVPEFQQIIREVPLYSIWDDHDFGKNDTKGELEGKENSRAAFQLFRANPSYGEAGQGLYTRFRRGPVEVFLLDTRWFTATEPSPADPEKPTMLGKQQWEWLKAGLKASDAPFKVLACGIIWNGATRPNKPDHWGAYLHERDALFSFIGAKKIPGVILVGGDIHRSRHLLHSVEQLAGYKIPELITSPLHDGIIESANAPHPDLVKDMGEPAAFLVLEATQTLAQPALIATFMNQEGEMLHQTTFTLDQLTQE